MSNRIQSYAEFWPHYLREHSKSETRNLHYAGTALTFLFLGIAILSGGWWWAAIPLAGYGFAWFAHFRVERNRPATFTHPALVAGQRLSHVLSVGHRTAGPASEGGWSAQPTFAIRSVGHNNHL